MKKITTILSLLLCLSIFGGELISNAYTVPGPTEKYDYESAQTWRTEYKISPADSLDGFGEKDRVGMKLHIDGKWIYLDTYEFLAGDKALAPGLPEKEEEVIFSAYGLTDKGVMINFLGAEPGSNSDYRFVGDGEKALSVDKFKKEYKEYQEDDIFIATPSAADSLVISFTAPKDGTYTFSETLLKRYTTFGIPREHVGIAYSVIKEGASEAITTVTSVKNEEYLIDDPSQKYTLNGSVELKKGENLLFIMEASPDNKSEKGLSTRIKELTVSCGKDVYTLEDFPGTAGAITAKGYSEGEDIYFWYETDKVSDPNQKITDAFGMQSHNKDAVLSFIAPRDGKFTFTAKLQCEAGKSAKVDLVFGGETVVKDASVAATEVNVTHTLIMKAGERLDLVLSKSEDAKVYARALTTKIDVLYTGELDKEYDNGSEKPIYTIAMLSDLHIDGDMPTKENPLKSTITNAVDYIKSVGGADVIMLGGDIIGEGVYHTNEKRKSKWTYNNILTTMQYLDDTLATATKTGKNILYVSGNHDKQPGVVAEYKDPSVRIHSAEYSRYMFNRTGGFIDALYMRDIEGYSANTIRYPDEVLCYRYSIGGMEFIGINQSYTGNPSLISKDEGAGQQMYPQQALWVREQLEKIGKDKTVFVFCHYQIKTKNTGYEEFGAVSKFAHLGSPTEILLETFEQYPNVIYTYGHIHWRNETPMAWYNTSEFVWNYGNSVQNEDGSYTTDGYHYIYMGSISHSDTKFDRTVPVGGDSNVSQINMVDIYKDHITFRVVNVGAGQPVSSVRELTSYTIKRDMSQLDAYDGVTEEPATSAFETYTNPQVTSKIEETEATTTSAPADPAPDSETSGKGTGNGKLDPKLIAIPVSAAVIAGAAIGIAAVKKKKKTK